MRKVSQDRIHSNGIQEHIYNVCIICTAGTAVSSYFRFLLRSSLRFTALSILDARRHVSVSCSLARRRDGDVITASSPRPERITMRGVLSVGRGDFVS
jgi:hypothetical protein